MHLQVSGALVKMAQSGISKPELANYNFIPATHKEKTILRKWNQIGSNVWGFGKQLTYTSFYDREFTFSDNIKKLDSLLLHPEITSNLYLLDLHEELEGAKQRSILSSSQ